MVRYVKMQRVGDYMKVFISWSGHPSKDIAQLLAKYIPDIIPEAEIFYTIDSIKKGDRWSDIINRELSKSNFGILCITKDNFRSSWINYEAGALKNHVGMSKICPLLFDMQPSDIVNSPLSMYQMTEFVKVDMLKLFQSMNSSCEKPLENEILNSSFEKVWADIEREIIRIKMDDIDDIWAWDFDDGRITNNTYRNYLTNQLNSADKINKSESSGKPIEPSKDIIALMLKNNDETTEYFQISKDHVKSSYKVSKVTNSIGIALLIISIFVMIIFRQLDIAIIVGVAGAITEVIAGTVLWVHSKSALQLNHYYEALHENEKTLTAITLAEKMSEAKKDEAFMEIIRSQINNKEESKGTP